MVAPSSDLKLSHCDGKRIAVVFRAAGARRIFCGVGRWLYDEVLGDALHVRLEAENAGASMVLPEATWRGKVAWDTSYGCEVCITIW